MRSRTIKGMLAIVVVRRDGTWRGRQLRLPALDGLVAG
jgi:hypothetical protein